MTITRTGVAGMIALTAALAPTLASPAAAGQSRPHETSVVKVFVKGNGRG